MSPLEITQDVKAAALELGFDLVGIAPASAPPYARELDEWLGCGYAGSLHYLPRRAPELKHPDMLLPGLRSILSCAVSYRPSPEHWPLVGKHPVSCYAWGWDYHWVIQARLRKLEDRLRELVPGARTRCIVDSGPVLEKSFAQQAGLGFPGKNTLLLNRNLGSLLFVGEILTDAEMACDAPETRDPCGECRLCLDACPTGALVAPRVLDARRCISYRTQREDRLSSNEDDLHGMLWGCDLCQKACPYNGKAPPGREEAFRPRAEILGLTAGRIVSMDDADLKALVHGSPLEHASGGLLRRNAEHIRRVSEKTG